MAKADAKGVPPAKYALSYDCYQFIITYPFDLLTFNVLLFFKKSSIGQKILYCKKGKTPRHQWKNLMLHTLFCEHSHTFMKHPWNLEGFTHFFANTRTLLWNILETLKASHTFLRTLAHFYETSLKALKTLWDI